MPEQANELQHLYETAWRSNMGSSRSLCGRDRRGEDPITLARQFKETEPVCDNCRAVQEQRLRRSHKLLSIKQRDKWLDPVAPSYD